MNLEERKQYVEHRIQSAFKTFEAAKVLADNGFPNSAINRLYYSAFYAVNALLVKSEIITYTHSGAKNQFSLHFIKSKIFDPKLGKLFGELFDWRQKGDYDSMYDIDMSLVNSLFAPVEEFLEIIENEIINTNDNN
ncbi:MAG: hypothetical protein DRJ05_11470 [Bacteroidetes bacterium]|nr:MAG: hypothetical protein DRJ05_11470 [Bacteroidota bacterium]